MGRSDGHQQDGKYAGRSLAQRAPVSWAPRRRTREGKAYGRAFLPIPRSVSILVTLWEVKALLISDAFTDC